MNKVRFLSIIMLAAGALFALCNVHFAADVSVIAFPVALLITAAASYFLLLKIILRREAAAFTAAQKLLQYIPFALFASFVLRRAGKSETPYWFDVVTVVLWCAVFLSSQTLLYFLNEKRVEAVIPEWKGQVKAREKPTFGILRIAAELLDWADALLQAVFMVLLIQIFILQLYVIPSESMVPSFLVKDRVVVLKTASAPRFPLSDVGLPSLKSYRRGDVVVFRNPHYNMDRKSEVRTVVSQLIYMLTFTAVNLNVDENGQPKADPLVKRVCGVAGEQLMMQDGILYARTAQSAGFQPVKTDNDFAAWNLNALPAAVKRGIQHIPLSPEHCDTMLKIEAMRRDFSIEDAKTECRALAERFRAIHRQQGPKKEGGAAIPLYEYELFNNIAGVAQNLLASASGSESFAGFMTDWITAAHDADFAGDLYAEANFKLNLMIKTTAGKLIVDFAAASLTDAADISADEEVRAAFILAEQLNFYVMILDQRNMPVFPPCDADGNASYIPADCYFMMGDNRFNSLDMRHSYKQKLTALTARDPYSVTYYSNMAPQYVSQKHILGTTMFRFWPLQRAGGIKVRGASADPAPHAK